MNKTLYILIGPSGVGKTTWASKNLKNACVCSADHFFLKEGVYEFDSTKLPNAHGYSKQKCQQFMLAKEADIVIDNTNLTDWERKPYEELAEKHGYDVKYVAFQNKDAKLFAVRNAHKVPLLTIEKMLRKMSIPKNGEVIYVG